MDKKRIVVAFLIWVFAATACRREVARVGSQTTGYSPTVSVQAVSKATPEEIARRLITLWLDHYKSPSVKAQERLAAYELGEIRLTEQKEESFAVNATFAVKPAEALSDWMAGNGAPGAGGWIRDKFLFFQISREGSVYRLQVLGTGP